MKIKILYYYKQQLCKKQQLLPPQWVSTMNSKKQLKLCKINDHDEVSFSVTIHDDLSFCVSLFNRPIHIDAQDEKIHCTETIFTVINTIEKIGICQGNPDDKFIELAFKRNGKFLNNQGNYKI